MVRKKKVVKKKKSVKRVVSKKSSKKSVVKKSVRRPVKKKVTKKKSSKHVSNNNSRKLSSPSKLGEKKVSSLTKSVVKKKSVPRLKSFRSRVVKGRLSSGTFGFDSLVGGGFVKNSNSLIVGGSGSGKTIFGVQFLLDGIRSGDSCLYISFEERKSSFFSNILNVGIDLASLEKKGSFFFLESTPQKVKAMLDEGGGAIETLVLTKRISRIVIDSISSFTLLFEKELEKKEAALSLFALLRSWDCTTLLISDEDAIDETESSKIIDQEVDAIIKFYFKRGVVGRERFLEILKMRGTNHSLNVHSFKIDDAGLRVGKILRKK